eukprot:4752522-Pleurochrysis_carterae.AAC.1
MPLKLSRSSSVMFSAAQTPLERYSTAWLRVAAAVAVKAAESKRPTSDEPAASVRLRGMSACPSGEILLAHAFDDELKGAIDHSRRQGWRCPACSKKASAFGHIVGSTSR